MYRGLMIAAVVFTVSCSGSSEDTEVANSPTPSAVSTDTADNPVSTTPPESVMAEVASVDTGWEASTVVLAPGEFTILKHRWLTSQEFLIEADPVGEIDVVLGGAVDETAYNAYKDDISDGQGSQAVRLLNCLAAEFGSPFEPAVTSEDVDVASFDDVSVTVGGETMALILLADFFVAGKSEGNVNISPYPVDTDVYWLIGAVEGGEVTVRTRAITPPEEVRRDRDDADIEAFFAPYASDINDWVSALGEPDREHPQWCPDS